MEDKVLKHELLVGLLENYIDDLTDISQYDNETSIDKVKVKLESILKYVKEAKL